MPADLSHEWELLRISQETISWRCQRCGNLEKTRTGTPDRAGCPGEHPPRDAVHGAIRAMLKNLLAIDWSVVTEEAARSAWDAACDDVGRLRKVAGVKRSISCKGSGRAEEVPEVLFTSWASAPNPEVQ